MVKGLLFDFDGTLTRPGALDFAAIKRAMGCPPEEAILEFLARLAPGARRDRLAILDAEELRAAAASEANTGAEACLARLREQGLPVAILTRNSAAAVTRALLNFKTTRPEHFAVIISRDMAPPKPNPAGVRLAARLMQLDPSQLVVVGDFRFDVMAGRAAGAVTVWLSNGQADLRGPLGSEADYRIGVLTDLLDLEVIREAGRAVRSRGAGL